MGPISPYWLPSPRAYRRGPCAAPRHIGKHGVTRIIGDSQRANVADGIWQIIKQQINAPGVDFRAGYGATAEGILPCAWDGSCALMWGN